MFFRSVELYSSSILYASMVEMDKGGLMIINGSDREGVRGDTFSPIPVHKAAPERKENGTSAPNTADCSLQ